MIIANYFREIAAVAEELDVATVYRMINRLVQAKEAGSRLFVLGVGGSAANASHAVNDFRKICRMQAFAPTDNVAELTAWTNDHGWDTAFENWLGVSSIQPPDLLMVLSVSGGRWNISKNLIGAVQVAKRKHVDVLGIVGPEGGYTAVHGDIVLKIPVAYAHFITSSTGMKVPMEPCYITAFTEAFQMIILHGIVNDERLKA